jgi:predicted membrane protein
MANRGKSQGRIFWGLILIAFGVGFLLDQLGYLDFGDVLGTYWPVIFIIIGLSILINNNFKDAGAGIFFIAFGAFFLLVRLRILGYSLWHYWPVLIIAAGLWILISPFRGACKKKIPELTVDELDINQVFSGSSRRIESRNFKGGKAEVVFGSAEIDLSGAGLEGGKATLYLSAVFGSIEVRVPREWEVVVEGSPFLGTIEDKKRGAAGGEKTGTLFIKASVAFGSIELKD